MGGCVGVEKSKEPDQKDPGQTQYPRGCLVQQMTSHKKIVLPKDVNYPIYINKYDYDSRTNDDLSFKKGDLMYIITMDEDHWWFARSQDMAREGYVPSNYVAEWKSMEAEE